LHPLGAGREREEVVAAAGCAGARQLLVAAEVTPQRGAGCAVENERHRAVRAPQGGSARAAEQAPRMSPLVEEEDGLLAARRGVAERLRKRGGEQGRIASPLQGGLAIDDCDRRERAAVDALWQPQGAQPALFGAPQSLQRWGRAAQHGDRAGVAGADERQVAGVVAQPVFLLVGGLVLLVDDDDP